MLILLQKATALAETQLEPELLSLELTESMLMHDTINITQNPAQGFFFSPPVPADNFPFTLQ